jgi:hypothetical protein
MKFDQECQDASNLICQSKAEVTASGQPAESKPLRISLVPQEGDDISEGFWKLEVRSLKSSVEKLKRSQKILKAICVTLLFLFAIGLALIGKNYLGAKSPQSLSQGGVVEAQELIIRRSNGQAHACLSERDGKVWFELRDSVGKAQASISLAAGDEPKLALYDKDQKKLGEWGGAEAKPVIIENSDKTTAAPAVAAPQESVTLIKYIGSKTSNKYHYPECKWGKQIVPEKRLGFHSVKEAQDNGYVQCRACRPPLRDMPDESIRTEAWK